MIIETMIFVSKIKKKNKKKLHMLTNSKQNVFIFRSLKNKEKNNRKKV